MIDMRKLWLLTAVTLVGFSVLEAQPRIQVVEGTKLKFDDTYTNHTVSKEVTVKNVGLDTLRIENINAQCGCTATMMDVKTLAPGDSSSLSITFDPKGYPGGAYTKNVSIASNDPDTPSLTLEFEAEVIEILKIEPSLFSFNNSVVDSSYVRKVTIKNPSKVPIVIKSVNTKFEQLKLSLKKTKLMPGESTELEATLHPTRTGSYQGIVNLVTDHPVQPNFEIRFLAWVTRK